MEDTFSTYHPIVNFVFFVIVLVIGMFVNHPVILGISFIAAVVYSFVLLGWRKSVKMNLVFSLPVMLITMLINPMFNHYGVTILFYLRNGDPMTLESMIYGVVMAVTLVSIIIWFSCYTKIMTSDKFIYLFGRIIPGLSLIFSMVLRFVPKFIAQIKVISNGQKCVGRDLSNGNIFKRAKHGITILSIMITWALENAIETADSMKARGYGLRGRTAFSLYRFDRRDAVVMSVMTVLLVGFIIGTANGCTYVLYNPRIKINGIMPVTPGSFLTYFAYAALCFLPVIIDGLEELKWRRLRSEI